MIIPDMPALGQIIRDTRKRMKMTQQDLAALSGTGIRFVREVEQGKESCHIGKVMNLMAILGLTLQVAGIHAADEDEA